MADEDPYEKIVSLTNERDEARKEASDGKQAQARLDALRAQHQSSLQDIDRLGAINNDRRKELASAKSEVEISLTAQRQAEIELEEAKSENESLQARVDGAEKFSEGSEAHSRKQSEEIDRLKKAVNGLNDIIENAIQVLHG